MVLAQQIKVWGAELGFHGVGITDCDLGAAETELLAWLALGYHGEMDYMAKHGSKRTRPAELVPGTVRVISVRMDYFPPNTRGSWEVMAEPELAYISRYALGRDYHKVMRTQLQRLAERINQAVGTFNYRVFIDSAPVMEVALASKAGLGWRGKHTLLLNREAGSWFFLGEIYTDLPLLIDQPVSAHCGNCQACIDVCPTQAILAPNELDARRCISYLTIEHSGVIPVELRPLMGNRIYGCDDCQLVCPWNRFAKTSSSADFSVRNGLDSPQLVDLLAWTEEEFNQRLQGSAIRRIGHECWLRNIAVALGNAPANAGIVAALNRHADHPSAIVREHVQWALSQHQYSVD